MLLQFNDLFVESRQQFRTGHSATGEVLDYHRDGNHEYRRAVESNRATTQWMTEQGIQAQQFSRKVEPADLFGATVQRPVALQISRINRIDAGSSVRRSE